MSDTITYIGDVTDDPRFMAITPDASTLYVWEVNRGSDIREYAYPALTGGTIVVNNTIGPMAMDATGTLYWTDDNVVGATAATQIWKDISSPTLVWTSAYGASNPTVTMCWSPYDGLLYALVNGALYSVDPSSGSSSLLFTPTIGTPSIENGPVPTLDGGIWWSFSASGSSKRVLRYDIPTSSGVETSVSTTHYQDMLLPRPNGTTWGYKSLSTGWAVAADLSATSNPAIEGLGITGVRGVGYTPDLSLVVFNNRSSNSVWQVGELARAGMRVGFLRMTPT